MALNAATREGWLKSNSEAAGSAETSAGTVASGGTREPLSARVHQPRSPVTRLLFASQARNAKDADHATSVNGSPPPAG